MGGSLTLKLLMTIQLHPTAILTSIQNSYLTGVKGICRYIEIKYFILGCTYVIELNDQNDKKSRGIGYFEGLLEWKLRVSSTLKPRKWWIGLELYNHNKCIRVHVDWWRVCDESMYEPWGDEEKARGEKGVIEVGNACNITILIGLLVNGDNELVRDLYIFK